MKYQINNPSAIKEGQWNERTCVRREGGYTLDTASVSGLDVLPKGAVLALNSGKATLCKTAVLHANAAASATSIQVEKGHLFTVGEKIAGSTISAINTTNTAYDTLTISALASVSTAGDVLNDANGGNAIGMNYATVKIDDFPSVTITVQAYEIEESTLPYPINATIKAALGANHQFKL